jgi:hypothetical protein
MTVPQVITVALPFVAALVSYALQQAHFDTRINTAIAGVSILLAAFVSLLLQGKLSGNVSIDTMAVIAVAVSLQAGPLLPLQRFLVNNFPVASKSAPASPGLQPPAK